MARAGFGARPQSPIPSRAALRLALLTSVVALAGCEGGFNPSEATRATGGGSAVVAASPRTIERDTEAPEVFNLEEAGLWDGRPSLGGVWVAHPDVSDPERVMIRNAQTGEAVIGALFRRERDNPGPRFQISSEAANALEILPGQPTTIRVTALRLEEIEVEPEARETAAAEDAVAADATETATAEDQAEPERATDAAAAAGTDTQAPPAERRGLRALFGRRDSTPAEDQAPEVTVIEGETPPQAEAAAPSEDLAEEAEATEPEPERRGLRALFTRRSAEPEPRQTTPTALDERRPGAPAGAEPLSATRESPAPAAPDRPRVAVEPEVAPPAGGEAAEEAPRERRGLRALFTRSTPDPEPQPADTTSPPLPEDDSRTAAATGPAPDRPFVQIGIFSVEANANAARDRMRAAGLPADIRQGRLEDRRFWRVVIGPAQTEAARADVLRQVRGMGFADAYPVRR